MIKWECGEEYELVNKWCEGFEGNINWIHISNYKFEKLQMIKHLNVKKKKNQKQQPIKH